MAKFSPGITIKKVWEDDDIVELKVASSDGKSIFINNVYVGHMELSQLVESLNVFREHVFGGLTDIRWGQFGPEYANGAFQARLHFHEPSKLYVSVKSQSDFEDFSKTKVASEATLYFRAQPIQLDNFINDLRSLSSRNSNEAYFHGIDC